jgi:hypothetical protein
MHLESTSGLVLPLRPWTPTCYRVPQLGNAVRPAVCVCPAGDPTVSIRHFSWYSRSRQIRALDGLTDRDTHDLSLVDS